jgi:hypothetical protein
MTEPELALPAGYRELLEDLTHTVTAARWRTQRTVNTELLTLYWRLGDAVLDVSTPRAGAPGSSTDSPPPVPRQPGPAL